MGYDHMMFRMLIASGQLKQRLEQVRQMSSQERYFWSATVAVGLKTSVHEHDPIMMPSNSTFFI